MNDKSVLSFDDIQIDTSRGELRKKGEIVKVEPQVLDLTAYFASHPGVSITRVDLIENVWSGRIVSDSAISTRLNAACTAPGDDGQSQRLIKTNPRRGFRFEGAINEDGWVQSPKLYEKPSIAVLPFRNLSGDPEQVYFSDGITDDIIIELAQCRELTVIARHTSYVFRDVTVDLEKLASDLGVQYVWEGSVRRSSGRIRVSAQPMDTVTSASRWAEKYD